MEKGDFNRNRKNPLCGMSADHYGTEYMTFFMARKHDSEMNEVCARFSLNERLHCAEATLERRTPLLVVTVYGI